VAANVVEYDSATRALGSAAAVVISNGAAVMVMTNLPEAVSLAASVTVTVRVNEPVAVGVPVNAPAALNCKPGGNPVADHSIGAAPPEAAKVSE
jgi:hypothetical protein